MTSDGNCSLLSFSTRELSERERLPFWREVFGRQVVRIDIEPQSDVPFESEAHLLALPGLRVLWSRSPTPAAWNRTPELVSDGDDDFVIVMPLAGALGRSQLGCDLEVSAGDAVGVLHSEPASIRFRKVKYVALIAPRSALSPFVAHIEDSSTKRHIPRGTMALRLLSGYLKTLREISDIADPRFHKLVTTHIYDLMALAIGATRDGKEVALARGVSAARLRAIKDQFALDPSDTLNVIAARQGVTPRYIQLLFEEEGTTFTAFALDQRLLSAYRMLTNQRYASWTVVAIALEAGFGDLSYFNRSFRRRYGASPSEIRNLVEPGGIEPPTS